MVLHGQVMARALGFPEAEIAVELDGCQVLLHVQVEPKRFSSRLRMIRMFVRSTKASLIIISPKSVAGNCRTFVFVRRGNGEFVWCCSTTAGRTVITLEQLIYPLEIEYHSILC